MIQNAKVNSCCLCLQINIPQLNILAEIKMQVDEEQYRKRIPW